MTGVLIFGLGLIIFMGAVLDIDLFMNLTRSARSGYPLGKTFPRLLYSIAGVVLMLVGLNMLLST